MNSSNEGRFSRARAWLKENRRHVFFESIDFRLAFVAFILSLAAGLASDQLRERAVAILITEAALGVAVLGVVLTALAILVGLLDQHYLHILERADDQGRLEPAFQPYRVTAVVAAAAAVFALASAGGWSISIALPIPYWVLRALGLALSTGMCVWAIVGTVQLVDLTAFHGAQRGYLMRGIREARREGPEQKTNAG